MYSFVHWLSVWMSTFCFSEVNKSKTELIKCWIHSWNLFLLLRKKSIIVNGIAAFQCLKPKMLYSSLLPLYLTHTQTHRQSCLWSILPILWLPLWSRLPSCLPWLVALASGIVSLILHCSPTISSLYKRSQWLSKTLLSVLLCSECPRDFTSLLEQNQVLPSGLETWDNLIFDFCRLWVLLPLYYLTLLALFPFLKVSSALWPQSCGVSIPATLSFPRYPHSLPIIPFSFTWTRGFPRISLSHLGTLIPSNLICFPACSLYHLKYCVFTSLWIVSLTLQQHTVNISGIS